MDCIHCLGRLYNFLEVCKSSQFHQFADLILEASDKAVKNFSFGDVRDFEAKVLESPYVVFYEVCLLKFGKAVSCKFDMVNGGKSSCHMVSLNSSQLAGMGLIPV